LHRQSKVSKRKAVQGDGRACPTHEPELSFNLPSHFFILLYPPVFNAAVPTADPCAETNIEEKSMFPLAKTVVHHNKNGRRISSRIGLVF
jgi:hypothetical protein